jgi:hypothetical protein
LGRAEILVAPLHCKLDDGRDMYVTEAERGRPATRAEQCSTRKKTRTPSVLYEVGFSTRNHSDFTWFGFYLVRRLRTKANCLKIVSCNLGHAQRRDQRQKVISDRVIDGMLSFNADVLVLP